MKNKFLSVYLHDHLSGAVGALALLERLEREFRKTPVGDLLTSLRNEILAEKEQLDRLCAHYPINTAVPRKFAAWLAEKGLQFKLKLDGSAEADFRLFESLEALSVGIAGKRLLWRTLSRQSHKHSHLKGPDYRLLTRMAVRQRKALEIFRLQAANRAMNRGAKKRSRPSEIENQPAA